MAWNWSRCWCAPSCRGAGGLCLWPAHAKAASVEEVGISPRSCNCRLCKPSAVFLPLCTHKPSKLLALLVCTDTRQPQVSSTGSNFCARWSHPDPRRKHVTAHENTWRKKHLLSPPVQPTSSRARKGSHPLLLVTWVWVVWSALLFQVGPYSKIHPVHATQVKFPPLYCTIFFCLKPLEKFLAYD